MIRRRAAKIMLQCVALQFSACAGRGVNDRLMSEITTALAGSRGSARCGASGVVARYPSAARRYRLPRRSAQHAARGRGVRGCQP